MKHSLEKLVDHACIKFIKQSNGICSVTCELKGTGNVQEWNFENYGEAGTLWKDLQESLIYMPNESEFYKPCAVVTTKKRPYSRRFSGDEFSVKEKEKLFTHCKGATIDGNIFKAASTYEEKKRMMEECIKKLKNVNSLTSLVKLGIYNTPMWFKARRVLGLDPPCFKSKDGSGSIFYNKKDLILWLENQLECFRKKVGA